jgi:hypothetical protein
MVVTGIMNSGLTEVRQRHLSGGTEENTKTSMPIVGVPNRSQTD